jgi:hypothetical protein
MDGEAEQIKALTKQSHLRLVDEQNLVGKMKVQSMNGGEDGGL